MRTEDSAMDDRLSINVDTLQQVLPTARLFEGFFWISPEKDDTTNVTPNSDNGGFKSTRTEWTYPRDVSSITKSFTNLAQFCFPDLEKARLEAPATSQCKNEFFTFTLTEGDGNRVYGVCMRALFRGETHRFDVKRRPRHCLCIITRHPFFSLLRTVLLQVHALALIEETSNFPPATALQFLEQVYSQVLPEAMDEIGDFHSLALSKLAVRRSSIPSLPRDFTIQLPRVMGHGASVPVLPLLEALGVENFMQLLSAALCERRIIFVADDVEKLSSAVLATASMLQPFDWQHIFIPLLPSNMFDYVAAPMPYMIGIRRYLLPKLEKVALDEVVLVDVDAATLKVYGNRGLIKDFVGDAGSYQKQASENLDGLLKIGNSWMNMLMGRSVDPSIDNGPRDLMFVILSDLRAMLASKPSKSSLRGVASGIAGTLSGSAKGLEESKLLWNLKSEKVLRDTLMLFFVYLFADMEELMMTDSTATVGSGSGKQQPTLNRGEAQNGNAFGQGDSRAAFDLAAFLSKRSQMGDSKELQSFLAEFHHSQMFERFCDKKLKKLGSSKRGPGASEVKAPVSPHVVMKRRRVSSGSSSSGSNYSADGGAGGEEDVFELVCRELRVKQKTPTISNTKQMILLKSSTKNVVDLHVATLQYTDGTTSKAMMDGNSEVAKMHQQQTIERICTDANSSDQFNKIMRTIFLRLESCRAAECKGHSGVVGMRALVLLRVLLISGPQCVLSYALDFIPMLRALLHPKEHKKTALSGLQEVANIGAMPIDVSTITNTILMLLLDHQRLQHQRHYAALVKDNAIPHLITGNQRMRAPPLQEFSKLHALLVPSDEFAEQCRMNPVSLFLTVPVMKVMNDDDDDEEDEESKHVVKKAKKGKKKTAKSSAESASSPASPTVKAAVSTPIPPPKTKSAPLVQTSKAKSASVIIPPPVSVGSSLREDDKDDAKFRMKNQDTQEIMDIREFDRINPNASAPCVSKTTPSGGKAKVTVAATKARMEAIYFKYNPTKISDIPALLTKYKGREEEILESLVNKYVKVRMEEIYSEYNPSKISEVPALLKKYKGREDEIIAALEKKYVK